MARVRAKNTRPELALRRRLWAAGYRFRLHTRLPGKPDLVFPKYRTVVFVDGDFWHARALREGGEAQLRQVIRGPRFGWWRDKLARNLARDDYVTRTLREVGWNVVRVWESDVLRDPENTVRHVVKALSEEGD